MADENKTAIPYLQFYKALVKTLKRNFHIRLLDVSITPLRLKLCFAVKKKDSNDYQPKIIEYYQGIRKVHIYDSLLDIQPIVIVDAATFLFMDENKTVKQ